MKRYQKRGPLFSTKGRLMNQEIFEALCEYIDARIAQQVYGATRYKSAAEPNKFVCEFKDKVIALINKSIEDGLLR